ncbi:MAG: maleylpyruvate isomerase N-terminal domain-containing protein [Chloroflexota bacterium]
MYLDALSFLEDERDAWRPFEALETLSDEQLSRPVEAAHGWSGRDLIAHLVAWQQQALAVARELAVNETSPTKVSADADWEARGDAINDEIQATWAALPMDEVRRRFGTVPGELRGYLTVVPETRWVKNAEFLEFFLAETIDHYGEHRDDLAAILAAAR